MTSCAGMTHVTVPQSNVNFVGKDIETQRHVSYTLKKTYVFGIGGFSAHARNTNIMDELMKKADLQKNEALAYIYVSKNTNTYVGVVTVIKWTATGYVVRPVENTQVSTSSGSVADSVSEVSSNDGPSASVPAQELVLVEQTKEAEAQEVEEAKPLTGVSEIGTLVVFPDGTKGVIFAGTQTGELLAVSLFEQKCTFINAKQWCESLGEGWRLPTKSELVTLFKEANQSDGFNGPISKALVEHEGQAFKGWYWSATADESDKDEAYNVSSGGFVGTEDKDDLLKARAVRVYKK